MKSNFLISVIIILMLVFNSSSFSQQLERSSGSANVLVENTMTKNEAREQAHELAIINAIENAFGTYVEQETDITIQGGRDYFSIIGATKVKGDWIETIKKTYKEDTRSISTKNGIENEIWITCNITGKVRKSTNLKAAINYETLNTPDKRSRRRDYDSGENLYLYFKSPVDGYLSVFLEDEDSVYRLLPDPSMTGKEFSAVSVKADQEYILFSKDNEVNNFGGKARECELFTQPNQNEVNKLYLIFSEDRYVKPTLEPEKPLDYKGQNYTTPQSLRKKDFKKWLADNRARDPGFLDVKVVIHISSR